MDGARIHRKAPQWCASMLSETPLPLNYQLNAADWPKGGVGKVYPSSPPMSETNAHFIPWQGATGTVQAGPPANRDGDETRWVAQAPPGKPEARTSHVKKPGGPGPGCKLHAAGPRNERLVRDENSCGSQGKQPVDAGLLSTRRDGYPKFHIRF